MKQKAMQSVSIGIVVAVGRKVNSGNDMPVVKKGNKWAIGSGKATYKSKASAERAYAGYRAKKHSRKK